MWQTLKFVVSQNDIESVSDLLENAEASSISITAANEQSIIEPLPHETPLWDELVISAVFTDDIDLAPLLLAIKSAFPKSFDTLTITKQSETDWQNAFKQSFPAQCFGKRLAIIPSWSEEKFPERACLQLDPGLAFGTGQHPTTALCLTWLDQHITKNCEVIDYGCGSGILAIAACLLGAKFVWAVDYDEQALHATRENIAKNNLTQQQISILSPKNFSAPHVDILIANIVIGPLIELEPVFSKCLKPGGKLALSGILNTQQEAIQKAYAHHFDFISWESQDEWCLLSATKK